MQMLHKAGREEFIFDTSEGNTVTKRQRDGFCRSCSNLRVSATKGVPVKVFASLFFLFCLLQDSQLALCQALSNLAFGPNR